MTRPTSTGVGHLNATSRPSPRGGDVECHRAVSLASKGGGPRGGRNEAARRPPHPSGGGRHAAPGVPSQGDCLIQNRSLICPHQGSLATASRCPVPGVTLRAIRPSHPVAMPSSQPTRPRPKLQSLAWRVSGAWCKGTGCQPCRVDQMMGC